jgi:hypothetical protein
MLERQNVQFAGAGNASGSSGNGSELRKNILCLPGLETTVPDEHKALQFL